MSPEPDPQDETKRVPASYPTQVPLGIGAVLDSRYRPDELIGRGATAAVFRATDELLGRPVAVKVFHAHLDDPTTRARQLSEMKLLASLNHPNLVTIYDARLDDHRHGDGPAYLVMELVEGSTLRDTMGTGMPDAEVASIGVALAGALGFIHARGLVHRDIKPANILISASGTVKLSDFGIARLLGADRMTSADNVVGTPAYFSPEQAVGAQIEAPTDIYALGLVLLECFTGQQTFTGSAVETAIARLSRDPHIPSGISPGWRGLLSQMTAREPAERPTAQDVTSRLEALRSGRSSAPVVSDAAATAVMQPVAARTMPVMREPMRSGPPPTRSTTRVSDNSRRRRGPILVAAGVLVLAAAIAAGVAASSDDDTEVPAGGSSTSQSAVAPPVSEVEQSAPAATTAVEPTSESSSAVSTSPPSPPSPASEAAPSAKPTKEKKDKKSDQPTPPTPG